MAVGALIALAGAALSLGRGPVQRAAGTAATAAAEGLGGTRPS